MQNFKFYYNKYYICVLTFLYLHSHTPIPLPTIQLKLISIYFTNLKF